MHAADLGTLDLLTFLAQPLRAVRALVIATVRLADPRVDERMLQRLARMAAMVSTSASSRSPSATSRTSLPVRSGSRSRLRCSGDSSSSPVVIRCSSSNARGRCAAVTRRLRRCRAQVQGDASSVMPVTLKTMLAPHVGDLLAQLEQPGARMLDIGTGVGALAIASCRTCPQLSVVGIDSAEPPLALARENVARANFGERIELRRVSINELRDERPTTLPGSPDSSSRIYRPRSHASRRHCAPTAGSFLFGTASPSLDAKHDAMWGLVMDAWGGTRMTPAEAEGLLRDAGLRDVRVLPTPHGAPLLVAGRR